MNSRLLIPTMAIALSVALPAFAADLTGSTTATGSASTSVTGASTLGTSATSSVTNTLQASTTGSTQGTTTSGTPGFPNTGAGGTWFGTLLTLIASAAVAISTAVYLRRQAR